MVLDHGGVYELPHLTAQGVSLADQIPLGKSVRRGIAGSRYGRDPV
jgi:hypothetical protein